MKNIELRNYTDAELRAIRSIKLAPDHFQNPFKHLVDNPLGSELAHRWAWIHFRDDMAAEPADDSNASGTDLLLQQLMLRDSDFHKTEGPAGSIFFPSVPSHPPGSKAQKDAEAQWEARSNAMHAAQVATMPAPKPLEGGGIKGKRRSLIRGD